MFNHCGCSLPNFNPQPLTLPSSGASTCAGGAIVIFMTILETLLQNSCKINDPCGRVIPKQAPDNEYDFVVVGGGSGGSVVAGRLAEVAQQNNWKILLVEAGGDQPAYTKVPLLQPFTLRTNIDWNFTTEESSACLATGGICSWPRGKVLGGSGVLNGMIYLRATRKDIERWVEAGNNEWTYDELLRLYKKSEDNRQIGTLVDPEYHSKGGPWTIQQYNYVPPDSFEFLKAVKQAGYDVVNDLNGKINHGFYLNQANTRNGQRFTTADAYLKPQRNNPNLHIMLNSMVGKILIDNVNNTKTATGLELTYNNKTYIVKVKKEIILAAGAVQTPQLLLLSGIGDKKELSQVGIEQVHDLPAVGKGLEDHLIIHLIYGTRETVTRYDWFTVTDYLATAGGPMSAFWMHHIIGRLNTSYSTVEDPDGQFYSYTNTKTSWCRKTRAKTFNIAPSINQPRSKGYITLRTNDIVDQPKIVANYFTNDTDIKIMIELIRIAQNIMKAPVLKQKFGLTQMQNQSYYTNCSSLFTYDSDDWWGCVIKYGALTVYHPSCTCKMGPASNPEACVNQQLQLHGIENIRVTDASVFPSITSANTQATVVAVAERGAELIINKYTRV